MKWLTFVWCLIIGHNKILVSKKENRFTTYHSVCSQCQKKWNSKKLSTTPKIKFKKYSIKMRAQGKKVVIKKFEEVLVTKQKVNFYAL